MTSAKFVCLVLCAIASITGVCGRVAAQGTLATVSGRVFDPNAAVIIEATVTARNVDTGVETVVRTNEDGIYSLPNLNPGNYEFTVYKKGFKVISRPRVTLHVADTVSMNYTMQVGNMNETVRVEGGAPLINTESATVSTVIDREFAENLPMNGRSFQTLIQLTPGVVSVPSTANDPGQFSINGQRADANYWTVDGVSANIGVTGGNGLEGGISGSLGGLSAQGGTSSLVSIDAMQEFRIQTSTYAPEFGRQPGGQISIVTRPGTDQFHGTLFEYLRNDALDSNNWFNNSVSPQLPKAEERQNNFGGTLGGPLRKDRTFFFFSYEGNRLRLPRTLLTTVPSLSARTAATSVMQPFFNAFPLPSPGGVDHGDGTADLNASFSDRSSLNAVSLRIDHNVNSRLNLFGRYNYAPSDIANRGAGGNAPNVISTTKFITQTGTLGATWTVSPQVWNDFRFNYSRNHSTNDTTMDGFLGAVPLSSLPFPSPYTTKDANFYLNMPFLGLAGLALQAGYGQELIQRQFNIIDSFYVQRGSHSLKFGGDFRRLSPIYAPQQYDQETNFFSLSSAQSGTSDFAFIRAKQGATLLFKNLGLYAQDTWRPVPRLTLTFGLRWDIDFVPSSIEGPTLLAVTGYNLRNLSQLALAPQGTSPYSTTYGNVAPRVGVAYELRKSPSWESALRGGFGVFYNMASSEVGNIMERGLYPFLATSFAFGVPFPYDSATAAPPPFTTKNAAAAAPNPNLELPYTLEWNVALEQALGRQQSISVTYTGAVGRKLLQATSVSNPTPNLASAYLIDNTATSDYHGLQIQFQRRLSRGFQALASYSWAHSIDTASAGSAISNLGNAGLLSGANRGPSDFDIRHAFSTGLTYQIGAPRANRFERLTLGGWSLESVFQVRSAPPVDVFNSLFGFTLPNNFNTYIRPDVTGQPFYLSGSQYPGGKAFNPAAFTNPPTSPAGCDPAVDFPCAAARQGNLSRNALRGFGAWQWDFAVHRDFHIHGKESLKLQFRAEMFNVLNHPNFGAPLADINPFVNGFGKSYQLLADSLDGNYLGGANQGSGSFSPIYQFGGPRTVQFGLKLMF